MNRLEAIEILKKYTKNPNLVKHGIAVGSVMRHFAKINNEDIEYWENVGILHDIDYELYPNEHCTKCIDILKKEGIRR